MPVPIPKKIPIAISTSKHCPCLSYTTPNHAANISIARLLLQHNASPLTIGRPILSTLDTRRRNLPELPRNNEAPSSPDPNEKPDGTRQEQRRHEHQQRDADPEEGKDESGAEGEADSREGKGREDDERQEGEDELCDEKGLC